MGVEVKPQIISEGSLEAFLNNHPNVKHKDITKTQFQELARINNPDKKDPPIGTVETINIFYPWLNTLLRCVNDKDLFVLRTNRNRELITISEQERLDSAVIGVAGMSVGSGIALSIVYSGMSRKIKIADRDILDSSNLNRLRESLVNVGEPKVGLAAQHIYEIDPFAEVYSFSDGVTDSNIGEFFSNPKLDVVIDEIDDFKMKVIIRKEAKARRIPVLMFTSLGDNILVDVERYDTNLETELFNGLLQDGGEEIMSSDQADPDVIRRYSVELVGSEYIPTSALESVVRMGKSLVGRPQLYSTIAVDGGLAAYTVRRLLLEGDIPSGRYFVRFSDIYKLDKNDFEMTDRRIEILEVLKNQ